MLQTVFDEIRAENQKLREALETLMDYQNGPPLHSERIHWHAAMLTACELTGRKNSAKYHQDKINEISDEYLMNTYNELKQAYKEGYKASKSGLNKINNPYPEKPIARSYSQHSEWTRGWIAGKKESKNVR